MYSDQKNNYSYGDSHNYQQQRHPNYPHDYRSGMNRQEPRNPYGYQQGQVHRQSHPHGYQQGQSHPPSSPHKYGTRDYRGSNIPRSSDPRKSFVPSGPYRNYPASGGYRNHQHQKPSSSNYNNKGIRKDSKQPQHHNSSKSEPSKETDSRKSLAPKEKTVHFDSERKEGGNVENSTLSSAEPIASKIEGVASEVPLQVVTTFDNKDGLSVGEDTSLNRTFTLDDGVSTSAPTSNIDGDVSAINLPPTDSTKEADCEKMPPTSQECTILENSYVQEVIVPSENEVISNDIEIHTTSQPVVEESVFEPPAIIVTEPQDQECEEVDKNVEIQCETEIEVSEENAGSVEPEAVAVQLDEEISKEVEAITPRLSDPNDSFRLVLEDHDRSVVEVIIESSPTMPVHEFHDEVPKDSTDTEFVLLVAEEVKGTETTSNPIAEDVSDPVDKGASDLVAKDTSDLVAMDTSDIVAKGTSDPVAEGTSDPVAEGTSDPVAKDTSDSLAEDTSNTFAMDASNTLAKDNSDPPAQDNQGLSTPEQKKVVRVESPIEVKDSHRETVDAITENLDVLYITPGRKGRKSRALLDTTNIVESSSIQYVVREVKQKEALDTDVVITPVRRSTRKKAETPGTLKSTQDIQELTPGVLQKAKIVPNQFLPS